MSNLAVFDFNENLVRFVDGKPVANDVAKALGYSDPAKTISTKVDEENRSVTKTVTVDGKEREVMVLEEAGIYQLIFSSKLGTAKAFQRWVFNDVLPSIRKTGSYSLENSIQQLPTKRDSIDYVNASTQVKSLPDGYLKILLEQALVDELSLKQNTKQLVSTSEKPVSRTIVKVRAKELGYTDKQIGTGSALGMFVAKRIKHDFVERVGRYTTKHYVVNNELDHVIRQYFEGLNIFPNA
jgi:prophage antirepressor-like protein